MDPATMLIPDPNTCPPLGRPPSFKEFNAGLGDYALGLYAICAVVVSVLAILVRVKAKVFSGSNLTLFLCGRAPVRFFKTAQPTHFFYSSPPVYCK